LVLEDETKEILEILVHHAADSFEDIVSGKQGGSIVLLAGVPGVGKTLTAEIYSEVMERPLYRVQSSQLGITVQALEEELKAVLQRAERWGAILLIDEADVYVRARGTEIEQNAIVGVFLRVLEYYRGVLFMTTNMGTCIDDAIVSRLTARINYELPSEENQCKLWMILSEQNGVKLGKAELSKILASHPRLSGRDIKNLLKLAGRVANSKDDVAER
jgi:SpoVK/Ycf46/Vps4 family AAA+-type ATPase